VIALAPGASWPSKRWLPERWRELATGLEQSGARLLVLGQTGEGLPVGTDLTGKTSVRDAACLLHGADLLVCCDSGLMHLALAAETPVVALFGPTDPAILIRDEPLFTPLCSTASCRGFWNHAAEVGAPGVCPEGHENCLESITVAMVHEGIRQVLGARW
jgi:ADP-heptose:LPS heptosyltransferase